MDGYRRAVDEVGRDVEHWGEKFHSKSNCEQGEILSVFQRYVRKREDRAVGGVAGIKWKRAGRREAG